MGIQWDEGLDENLSLENQASHRKLVVLNELILEASIVTETSYRVKK